MARFLDSVLDRYSELAIFLGISDFFIAGLQTQSIAILVFLATAGSVLVSYIRARAQSLGIDTKIGILTRVERYLVIVPSLLFSRPDSGLVDHRNFWKYHCFSAHLACQAAAKAMIMN